jgi:predicted nucleotidyltransferase
MDTPYERLLVSLARADVNFLIVGGVAVALNGFVRTTEDVDILIERSEENVERLLGALASFGQGHARELSFADFDEAEGAVRVVEEFPLDIFTIMRGHTYRDLLNQSLQTDIQGAKIGFLNAEGLIQLKQSSEREKDQIDVAALRRQSSSDSLPPTA